ncbi:MAG: glycerophosphodiester phosphodiesterase family protein [Gammaproteobacteria bacterium]|nr:glycerophosphodiester phosphodiesterase family protein [Gammaproteobacteria bacterium]
MFSRQHQSSTLITMVLPELIAHRGYALHYPENTLVAIESAIRAGARFVEVDIQLTSDKEPVLVHDRDLERLCGITGKVHEFSLARLRNLRASEFGRFGYRYVHVPIPTLAELVALLQDQPQVGVFVEIKRIAIERFGIEPVLACVLPVIQEVRSRCVLISFSLEFLLAARRAGWHSVGAILEGWGDRRSELVRKIRPDYLFCDAASLPRRRKLRASPAKLAVYEIEDPDQALALAKRGVDMIETFAIGEMRSAFDLLREAPA